MPAKVSPSSSDRRPAAKPAGVPARHAAAAWTEIRGRLAASQRFLILLDFDGTLVRLQRRPEDVTVPESVGRILSGLIAAKNVKVAIVSGRRVSDLQRLLPLTGLNYYGVHGVECNGRQVISPSARTRTAKRAAQRLAVRHIGKLAGILIEDKGLGFAVHYRVAGARAKRLAGERLRGIVEPHNECLHILAGKKVWEVLPREVTGKSIAVAHSLAGKWRRAAVMYIGDDRSDEEAFRHLPGAVTIRVGAKSKTNARYYLKGPEEVLRFLARLGEFFASKGA